MKARILTRKDTRGIRPGRDPLLIRFLRLAERVRESTPSFRVLKLPLQKKRPAKSFVVSKTARKAIKKTGGMPTRTGVWTGSSTENTQSRSIP